jgi:tRNA-specific 2-thiouridylase
LATADKPESQEICFVPGGDYRDALRERAGWAPTPGPLVDGEGGERVGEHAGVAAYTVGQRQGLGVALGAPRYVSRIDPLSNTITIGRREDLETTIIELERATFVAGPAPATEFRAEVRIRHRATPIPATVRRPPTGASTGIGSGRWVVKTDVPVWAAAPGQAAVLYDGDVVLGGGRIARPAPAVAEARPGQARAARRPLVGSGV